MKKVRTEASWRGRAGSGSWPSLTRSGPSICMGLLCTGPGVSPPMGPQVMIFRVNQCQLVPIKSPPLPHQAGAALRSLEAGGGEGVASQKWGTPGISRGWGSPDGRWGHGAPDPRGAGRSGVVWFVVLQAATAGDGLGNPETLAWHSRLCSHCLQLLCFLCVHHSGRIRLLTLPQTLRDASLFLFPWKTLAFCQHVGELLLILPGPPKKAPPPDTLS